MTTEGVGPVAGRSRITITDPQLIRALAHPARLAILERLTRTDAVVTATECAQAAGVSPSAASYHLRELAKHGLIEEAPSRGDGRERVWQGVVSGFTIEAGQDAEPAARAAERKVVEVFLERENDRVRSWRERAPEEAPEWYDAVMISESLLNVTAEELVALNQAVLDLLEPYKVRERPDPPAGARRVAVQYRVVPTD